MQRRHGTRKSRPVLRIGMRHIMLCCVLIICAAIIVVASLLLGASNQKTFYSDSQGQHGIVMGPPAAAAHADQYYRHEPVVQENAGAKKKKRDSDALIYHFVVSSDCSPFQRWQVLTQLHSARAVNNNNNNSKYTWIVSGCPDWDKNFEQQENEVESSSSLLLQNVGLHDTLTAARIRKDLQDHFPIITDAEIITHPMVHFTPDYSNMSVYGGPFADGTKKRTYTNPEGKIIRGNYGNRYKFNNKPNGVRHWAASYYNNDHPENNDIPNEAIVLIDPDFLFVSPLLDANNNNTVRPGQPAAAKYGLGNQWVDFNRTAICGPSSRCVQTSPFEAREYYSAGPPYVIHARDVLPLSQKWAALVPPTYDQYPLLYAEMFAYSMAAAHLGLPHKLVDGLFMGCMVGWPRTEGAIRDAFHASAHEAKESVILSSEEVEGKGSSSSSSRRRGDASTCFQHPLVPPPFLHYCQRYTFPVPPDAPLGDGSRRHPKDDEEEHYNYVMAKRRVPQDILECDHHTREELRPWISDKPERTKPGENPDWNALAMCSIVRAVNCARDQYCNNKTRGV